MPTSPGTTGLVAWHAMDEASGNRADSHIGGYTLTDNNTVGSATGLVHANAASFVAANSETLSTTAAGVVNALTSAVSWTLGLWIYPTTDVNLKEPVGTLNSGGILCRRRGLTTFGSTEVAWDYFTDGGTPTRREGGAATPINTWSLIALKFDTDANELFAYTNGTATAGTSFTGTSSAQTTFRFGNRNNVGGGQYWDGRIGPGFIYSRALSTDELDWLYNGGAGRAYADLTGGASIIPHAMHHYRMMRGG